jgi:hypothetical protein
MFVGKDRSRQPGSSRHRAATTVPSANAPAPAAPKILLSLSGSGIEN